MKFVIEHTFDGITPADYEAVYFDESFNAALGDALKLGRQVLRLERTPERIIRHTCYDAKADPATPVGKALGSTRPSFVEELDYDVATHRGHWRTIPNVFRERVRNTGTFEVVATPTGVKRVVRGECVVSAFGLGRIVEKMIVGEIENSYASGAKLTREWLAQRS